MENETIKRLIPLLHWRWAEGRPIRLRGGDYGETALYYSHKRHLTSTGDRVRIVVPYNPSAPEHEDTVFADSGRRYPYPGALELNEGTRKCDGLTQAAPLIGEEDPRLAAHLERVTREGIYQEPEVDSRRVPVLKVSGQDSALHNDSLRVLHEIRRITGMEEAVRAWVQPLKISALLSVGVGEVMVHLIPRPLPEDDPQLKDVWRVDNPQIELL